MTKIWIRCVVFHTDKIRTMRYDSIPPPPFPTHTQNHTFLCVLKNQLKHVENTYINVFISHAECQTTFQIRCMENVLLMKWVQKSAQETYTPHITHAKIERHETIKRRKRSNSPNWMPCALLEMITWLHICFLYYVIY